MTTLVTEDGFNPATVLAADFGVVPNDQTKSATNLSGILSALDYLSATYGGGTLVLMQGIIWISDTCLIGNGSNEQQSTKHHNILIRGAGIASSNDVSNVDITAITVLRYDGVTSPSKAALELAGPLHNIRLQDFEADCANKAGYGINVIHVGDFDFNNVTVRHWTNRHWNFSTRTGFPYGCAYGCGNGTLNSCYAYAPAGNMASGFGFDSGASGGLVAAPDTANITIKDGVFFYGGSTTLRALISTAPTTTS
jgi:hypothetical protein